LPPRSSVRIIDHRPRQRRGNRNHPKPQLSLSLSRFILTLTPLYTLCTMANQSSSHWHSPRPPYPTLSTPASASTSAGYPAAPTSNPASTSSLSSDITGTGNNEVDSQRMSGLEQQAQWNQSYQPPMPSPTLTQNPHFAHFQPLVGDLPGSAEQQEQLARISAHLRGLQQHQQQQRPNPETAPQQGFAGEYFGGDVNAMHMRREAANQLVKENSLLSEAATRLIIKEMDNIGF
jgi:hypothetical protein